MTAVAPPPTPLHERGAPAPPAGGPMALLRFMRRNGMLKLRWGRRLQTDGLCFVGPGVTFEIGRGAVVRLGRWSWIGHGTKIRAHEGEVEIGAKTVLGQSARYPPSTASRS